jgi:hypothetical protein
MSSAKMKINQNVEESQLSHISTQVIYPISINQNSATIIIPNRGGSLDKNTCILLPAIVSDKSMYYPIGTGVASLIDSVSLLVNGKVIAQNSEVGNYITMSNSFERQEYRERVLLPRTGVKENYGPLDTGYQYLETANPGDFLNSPGKISIKDIQYVETTINAPQLGKWAVALNSFGDIDVPGVGNNNYNLSPDKTKTAQYYLYLEQLFPKLYGGLQLPIYLIESEVSIVIRFSSNNGKINLNDRVLDNSTKVIEASNAVPRVDTEVSCQIVTEEVVLLTDYLVPTQEAKTQLMEKVMSTEGLVLQYGDLLFNNFYMQGLSGASVAGIRNFKRYNFQLGMSNKVIRQMYLMFNPTQNLRMTGGITPYDQLANADKLPFSFSGYNQINCLKGKYCSRALSYLPDGERIQINFNSQNVFNTPLESSAHKIHELQTAYGANFCQPTCTYDFKDIVLDEIDATLTGWTGDLGRLLYQKSIVSFVTGIQGWNSQNLVGNNHYIGVNFQRPVLTADNRLIRVNLSGSGQRCSSTPIDIQIDRLCNRGEGDDDRNMICCMNVEKTMKIQGGQVYIDE